MIHFSAWRMDRLLYTHSCVHPVQCKGGVEWQGKIGAEDISDIKCQCEERGGVKFSLAFLGSTSAFMSVPCWVWMKTYCREQSCAGTFYFSHNKYCVVLVWTSMSKLKTLLTVHEDYCVYTAPMKLGAFVFQITPLGSFTVWTVRYSNCEVEGRWEKLGMNYNSVLL